MLSLNLTHFILDGIDSYSLFTIALELKHVV